MALVGVQQRLPAFRAAFTSGDYAKARSLLTELKVRPARKLGPRAGASMRANACAPRRRGTLTPRCAPLVARPRLPQILMTEFPYQKQSSGLGQPSAEESVDW